MIKLTTPNTIYLNKDHIVGFYPIDSKTNNTKLNTYIILTTDDGCSVTETVEEVLELLK